MTETKGSTPLADQASRDTIRDSLDRTLVVEAAAGTGKTTALVERILSVLERGQGELKRLVAVTFTEKAAGELKLRLRTELEKARGRPGRLQDAEVRSRLELGLAQLEEAHIGTIHGFCADLLKERPLQAGVDPLFEVATEEESHGLYRRVFQRWLEEKLDDPPPGVRRLLRRPASRDRGPVDQLFYAGWRLVDIRDFQTRWEIRHFDRESELDDLIERVLLLAENLERVSDPKDKLYLDHGELLSLVGELRRQRESRAQWDYDALEHRLPSLRLGKLKGRGPYGDGVRREDILDEREQLREALISFRERAGADLAAHLQHELLEVVARYQAVKQKAGRLDFLDLLVRARDLLLSSPKLRAELQSRFHQIFVDEFQDTDPLQAEILLLLSSDDARQNDWRRVRPTPGKLFVVADPKQSIYRFRRADVALYEQVKAQLLEAGARLVHLNVSFRAVPQIQEAVNASMSEVMRGSKTSHQASYVALQPHRPPIQDQPALVVLPIPRPYSDWGNLAQYAMQKSEPPAIAAWLKWLLEESGWRVTRRGADEPRAVTPSDVCLLFRRFVSGDKDVTQPYVDALQAFDIPHVLVGGRGFHQREEIYVMRTALAALERPDDELSVFATLRGPLFSLSDDVLFCFRQNRGSLHPSRELPEDLTPEEASVGEALDCLARLHRARNHRPIALTIRELLDKTRAQAGFALWQAGDQVLANVLRLLQLARNFEERGGLSFRGFVSYLEEAADDPQHQEQTLIEDGVEGVRLMTVHRAKGLEFPVVLLCDITCSLSGSASRFIDPNRRLFAIRLAGAAPWELLDHEEEEKEREAAESQRVLYVAATRARDLLVVPAVADEAHRRGWVGPLSPSLYPPAQNYHLPMVAPACPRFGSDTVIDRPMRAPVPPGEGIRPGLHKPFKGTQQVVWWDPELFEGQITTKPGVRRHWILQADGGAGEQEGPSSGLVEHRVWLEERERRSERGSLPHRRVITATRLAEQSETDGTARRVASQVIEGRDLERPSGKSFGALVHEVIARSPLHAERPGLEKLAGAIARLLGNDAHEIAAAVEAVHRALTHPLLARAREADARGECFRETPLVYRAPDETLVEGVPDLVFRGGEGEPWTVVDFKTDLRPDIGVEVYRRQVAIYLKAIAEATGDEAEGILLYL